MRDAVILAGRRTAVGAFGRSLRDISAPQLGRLVLEDLVAHTGIKPGSVDEVVFGHGYIHGGGLNSARISSQWAGFPYEVPAYVVMKACGSSLKAVTLAAQAVWTGQAELVVAGGVESMSQVPYLSDSRWGLRHGHSQLKDPILSDGLTCPLTGDHMGVTAERLAQKHGISRAEQDQFAADSHAKAAAAQAAGRFSDEIVPVTVESKRESVKFDADESVRPDVSLQKLAKLPTVFLEGGTVTPGNACPMNDGAAALLIASAEKAKQLGLEPLARIRSFAAAGVRPEIMGIGPVPATKKALGLAGLDLEDIDLIELNEAFAAQSLAVVRELGLDVDRLNVNGGAIALGHPVGATGAKLTTSIVHEMRRRQARHGLVTLCMGGGQGLSVIYENLAG